MKRIIRSTKDFMRMTKVVSQYYTVRNTIKNFISSPKEEVKEEEVPAEVVVEETVVIEEPVAIEVEQPVEVVVEKKVSKPRAPRKKVVKEVTEEPVAKKAPRKRKKKDA